MDDQEAIFATLERLGLPYRLLEHAPVRGMEDCARIAEPMGAVYPKNLFLAPRSGRSQYLLLLLGGCLAGLFYWLVVRVVVQRETTIPLVTFLSLPLTAYLSYRFYLSLP